MIEEIERPLSWKWANVLSSVAITEFDWIGFPGKKVLLFEELVHHGATLEKHRCNLASAIEKAGRDDIQIITAGFAVWEGCRSKARPDYSYFASIDTETYEDKREQIVGVLQQYGSLLLDTEHIELSIRLQCGMKDFYNALARDSDYGNTHSFVSGAGRVNLTINNPDILNHSDLDKRLIPGSNMDNVVCKIRVVEKSHDRFCILPIVYPNTRCEFDESWAENLPSFADVSYLRKAPLFRSVLSR